MKPLKFIPVICFRHSMRRCHREKAILSSRHWLYSFTYSYKVAFKLNEQLLFVTQYKAQYQHWQILFDYPERNSPHQVEEREAIYVIKQINAFIQCFNCDNLNKVFNFVCGISKSYSHEAWRDNPLVKIAQFVRPEILIKTWFLFSSFYFTSTLFFSDMFFSLNPLKQS